MNREHYLQPIICINTFAWDLRNTVDKQKKTINGNVRVWKHILNQQRLCSFES